MKSLLKWIDDRTGVLDGVRRCSDARIPGGASLGKIWPGAILYCFLVQAVTGFFLWLYYSPSAQTAWESVYYLQYHVPGGWVLRAMHHYSAQVLLVLIGIYMVQMIVTGACRAPRELVFWTVVLMGVCCLCLLLTGDLLAWDQNSYGATQVRVSFLTLLPWFGEDFYKLAAGGPAFGHLTLTRFLALHIAVFGGGFLVLWILHNVLLRRAREVELRQGGKSTPFWPNQAALDAAAWVVVMAIVLVLALRHGLTGEHVGLALGAPADPDPANFFEAARPEWAFLGLYEFSHLFPGELMLLPIFVIPGLLMLLVLAMPWIARTKMGRGVNVVLTVALLASLAGLSYRSLARDRADEKFQAALHDAAGQAERVLALAALPEGIPATGALTLLRNDAKTQGPRLFKQHCASCHDYTDAEGEGIKAEKSSAPDLYRFAHREWIAGLLDPKQIKTEKYFGNTKFKGGRMAGFVTDTFTDLEADEEESVRKVAVAVSSESQLESQQEADGQHAKRIAEGRKLVVGDWGCTDCHKFRDKGQLGSAPELTGWGSREWLIGIIANPADKRFYGARNDRMPAYAEFPDDTARNTLSGKEIRMVVDWLRGEWRE